MVKWNLIACILRLMKDLDHEYLSLFCVLVTEMHIGTASYLPKLKNYLDV